MSIFEIVYFGSAAIVLIIALVAVYLISLEELKPPSDNHGGYRALTWSELVPMTVFTLLFAFFPFMNTLIAGLLILEVYFRCKGTTLSKALDEPVFKNRK